VLDAEKSARLHAPAEELGVSTNLTILVNGVDGEEGLFRFCLAAPVKVRVGIEDLQPAHEEDQKRQRIDPVGQARNPVVTVG